MSSKTLFLVLTILNTLPILLFHFYPSLDGPSHIYNSNLLREILLHHNESLSQFFTINPNLVPNWSSHFILLLFRFVFSSVVADKIFLLLLALLLPYVVYLIINRFSPENRILAVFALPFVYTYLFGLGFYNYCLGVTVFLGTLFFWLSRNKRLSILNSGILLLLFQISFFTHILIFILTFSSVGLYSLIKLLVHLRNKESIRKPSLEIMLVILIGMPGIYLAWKYLAGWHAPDLGSKLPFNELMKWILDARSLIIHSYSAESNFSRLIFFSAMCLLLYTTIKILLRKEIGTLTANPKKLFFGILSAILLLLYLTFPDASSGGSYISVRINILLYLIFFIWLSMFKYPLAFKRVIVVLILIATVGLSFNNIQRLERYSKQIQRFNEAEKLVTKNSVILPIRNSGGMLDSHFSQYLGWKKPIVVLENFEATTMYYPLIWNPGGIPAVRLGDSVVTNVCLYNQFPAASDDTVSIDYIISWGRDEMNECKNGIMQKVDQYYTLIYSEKDPDLSLYKLKPTK
ncbi:MAG TPA: hypothetical protein ENI20_13585 [Bacteroides sp.]|nr:hypothetical protein [Bacteroides sp.]